MLYIKNGPGWLRSACLFTLITSLCYAKASAQGIEFQQGLNWTQVKEKAVQEHKYIFVDCYATWCGPCKQMDTQVYPLKEVSAVANPNFISIKAQMDKTDHDNTNVKMWYGMAGIFQKDYNITGFPTYLFFDPDGRIVHKAVGAMSPSQFIKLLHDAQDPHKQYYRLLKDFKEGKIDTTDLYGLALSFQYTDKVLGAKLALDYLKRIPQKQIYLKKSIDLAARFKDDPMIKTWAVIQVKGMNTDQYPVEQNRNFLAVFKADPAVQKIVAVRFQNIEPKQLLKKDEMLLLADYAGFIQPGDRYFQFFLQHANEIDRAVNRKGFADGVIDLVLWTKVIQNELHVADSLKNDINWTSLFDRNRSLSNPKIALRNTLIAKVGYYRMETNKAKKASGSDTLRWGPLYAHAVAEQIEKLGVDSTGGIGLAFQGNDIEFSIYYYSTDARDINIALSALDYISRYYPGLGFSYVCAGLLYRTGWVRPAIDWQEMTVNLAEESCLKRKEDPQKNAFYRAQSSILNQMKSGAKASDIIYHEPR